MKLGEGAERVFQAQGRCSTLSAMQGLEASGEKWSQKSHSQSRHCQYLALIVKLH